MLLKEHIRKNYTMNLAWNILDRRWMQRLCLFHKIYNLKSTKHLEDLVSPVTRFYKMPQHFMLQEIIVPLFNCRTEYFMIFFLFFANMINKLIKLGCILLVFSGGIKWEHWPEMGYDTQTPLWELVKDL